MFLFRGADQKRGIIIIAICILVVLSVGWFGWDPIFERFEKIRNPQGDITEQRLIVWKDSGNIIRDYPVFGTGFGTFSISIQNIVPLKAMRVQIMPIMIISSSVRRGYPGASPRRMVFRCGCVPVFCRFSQKA